MKLVKSSIKMGRWIITVLISLLYYRSISTSLTVLTI